MTATALTARLNKGRLSYTSSGCGINTRVKCILHMYRMLTKDETQSMREIGKEDINLQLIMLNTQYILVQESSVSRGWF